MKDMARYRYILCLTLTQLLVVKAVNYVAVSTTTAPTTHIVSYVHLKRPKPKVDQDHSNQQATNHNNDSTSQVESISDIFMSHHMMQKSEKLVTDDSPDIKFNTLENTNDELTGDGDRNSMNATQDNAIFNRNKQSIPVLEPVRRLLDNLLNNTNIPMVSHNHNHQHQLIANGTQQNSMPENNEMTDGVIETEEERQTEINSPEFQLLDVLGVVGNLFWSLIQNVQSLFAASSGASGTSSSSSSGGGNR